jgi:hypothetical protein
MSEHSRRAACLEFAALLDKLADETGLPSKPPRKLLRYGDKTLKKPPLMDRLIPRLHDRYWNWEINKVGDGAHKSLAEIVAQLCPDDATNKDDELRAAQFTLDQAMAIARTASDRAEIVERRATTIAASVAIATTFTVSGAAFIMDQTRLPDLMTKIFAVLLAFVTVCFVLSAWYSLRGLAGAHARTWNWESPWLLNRDIVQRPLVERMIYRSTDLLDDFAYNWEKTDLKKRCVDNAVLCLTFALWGIGILSAIVAGAILFTTRTPHSAH